MSELSRFYETLSFTNPTCFLLSTAMDAEMSRKLREAALEKVRKKAEKRRQ